ncbi:MAG: hypothetical protein ABI554_09860 [Flavobacterium sp.]
MGTNVNINSLNNISSFHYINPNFPDGHNEFGLNHQQWNSSPWYVKMFSSDPTSTIIASSGGLGFISGGGAMKFVQYSGKL